MNKDIEIPIINKTCSICLADEIIDPVFTNCAHYFCKKCFEDWLDTGKDICPMCRTKINHYKNKGENFKIVLINNEIEESRPPILIDNLVMIRKLSLTRLYLYFCFALLIYSNYLYYKLMYSNNLLLTKYDNCKNNLTETIDNCNNHNNYDNYYDTDENFIDIIMLHPPDEHFKRCMLPEKYYISC